MLLGQGTTNGIISSNKPQYVKTNYKLFSSQQQLGTKKKKSGKYQSQGATTVCHNEFPVIQLITEGQPGE